MSGARGINPRMTTTNARHLSLSIDHYTPREIVEAARTTMGAIDLDPASCALANREVVKASSWFGPGSKVSNGYATTWEGRVFLNPPGGKMAPDGVPLVSVPDPLRPDKKTLVRVDDGKPDTQVSSQKAWWFKLATEWLQGRVKQAVFVGFSLEILQTTQSGGPEVRGRDHAGNPVLPIPLDFPCCYPKSRIAYLKERERSPDENEDRKLGSLLVKGGSPPHASVIVWLHPMRLRRAETPEMARFIRAFSPLGKCVVPEGFT